MSPDPQVRFASSTGAWFERHSWLSEQPIIGVILSYYPEWKTLVNDSSEPDGEHKVVKMRKIWRNTVQEVSVYVHRTQLLGRPILNVYRLHSEKP